MNLTIIKIIINIIINTIITIILYHHRYQVELNLTKPNLATTGTSTLGEP